jgi:hypothetical protein
MHKHGCVCAGRRLPGPVDETEAAVVLMLAVKGCVVLFLWLRFVSYGPAEQTEAAMDKWLPLQQALTRAQSYTVCCPVAAVTLSVVLHACGAD